MPIEDFIIYVYCCVADAYDELVKTPLRSRGFAPKLTDSEVITMEIVGEFIGKDSDKGIWQYFKNHWYGWFPNLGSRSNFAKQSANLWIIKQKIQHHLAEKMGVIADDIHMTDGFPMPVCKIVRAKNSRCFQKEAAYGYCAAKDEKYYGFKGHLVVNFDGVICGYSLAPANIDERDILPETAEGLYGIMIGDKGLIRPNLKQQLAEQDLDLQTPLRKNMKDDRPKVVVTQFMRVRRKIETVIGQLNQRFQIEKIWARDMWHLANRFIRKLLSHTVCTFLNKQLGNEILQFDSLVEI